MQDEILLDEASREYRILIRSLIFSDDKTLKSDIPDFNTFALLYIKQHSKEIKS